MSSKISEMYAETSIQDLPDEMLEHILRFLNLDDRRPALRVCRRWSTLKPFDWSSVQLVVNFAKNVCQEDNYHRTLLASSRQYKHLVFYFGKNSRKYELLVEVLQHFSHKVETLKIIPYCLVPIDLMLITQILSLCSNLRHLHIGSGVVDIGLNDLDISPLHKLEELYLGGVLLPNMINITPNITRLHMQIFFSEEALIFLRHFSSQLVELEMLKSDVTMVCELQFPLLEKLIYEDWGYFAKRVVENVEKIELFFLQLPLLKEVTLRCNLDDRAIQHLCRSCVNIQFLCVSMDLFLQDCFRAICELKHLRHLRIEYATVKVPPDMYSQQTSLQKLTLNRSLIVDHAKFNSFVQRAIPNLAVMEFLAIDVRSIKIYRNIPSLQRLVVSVPNCFIKLGQFLEFCASHAPKELRFMCWTIFDIPENETLYRIPVQKLVLDSPLTSPSMLWKIISSMEELRWLEIARTKRYSPEEISSLREQFPRCNVVAKQTIVIEEV